MVAESSFVISLHVAGMYALSPVFGILSDKIGRIPVIILGQVVLGYSPMIDRQRSVTATRLFTGWMFASSPAVSALEHPVYDVWVVDCKTAANSSSR